MWLRGRPLRTGKDEDWLQPLVGSVTWGEGHALSCGLALILPQPLVGQITWSLSQRRGEAVGFLPNAHHCLSLHTGFSFPFALMSRRLGLRIILCDQLGLWFPPGRELINQALLVRLGDDGERNLARERWTVCRNPKTLGSQAVRQGLCKHPRTQTDRQMGSVSQFPASCGVKRKTCTQQLAWKQWPLPVTRRPDSLWGQRAAHCTFKQGAPGPHL